MAACNEQIELGIPLNENLICQPQVRQRPSSLSQDVKVWFFYGLVGGAIAQLASLGVAFLVVGHSSTIFISSMITTSLGVVALWVGVFRFLEIILSNEFLNCDNEENECKPANDSFSKLRDSCLYGVAVSYTTVTN